MCLVSWHNLKFIFIIAVMMYMNTNNTRKKDYFASLSQAWKTQEFWQAARFVNCIILSLKLHWTYFLATPLYSLLEVLSGFYLCLCNKFV